MYLFCTLASSGLVFKYAVAKQMTPRRGILKRHETPASRVLHINSLVLYFKPFTLHISSVLGRIKRYSGHSWRPDSPAAYQPI